jgi:predicted amidohydrolase YtcJ
VTAVLGRSADRALTGVRIRPVSEPLSPHDAILVRGGRIERIGSTHEVLRDLPAGVEVHDLGGATALPGFIDSHMHLENGDNYDHSMDGATTAEEILDRLRGVLAESDPDGPVLAHGSSRAVLPSIDELDAVEGERAVLIGMGDGSLVVNSAALRLSTARHGSLFVERQLPGDGDGPTGRFKGRDIKDFVRSVTGYDHSYVEGALLRGLSELNAAGITSVHHVVRDPLPVRVWQRLRDEGRLPMRVGLLMRAYESKIPLDAMVATGLLPGFGDPWLRLQGVKLSIDGHFPNGGAAFREPYADDPSSSGSLRAQQDDVDRFLMTAHAAGLRCAVHANGDLAIDMALAGFAAALEAHPRPDHRHRLEHAGNLYLRPDQIETMKRLGLVAVPNPPFMHERVRHVQGRLGPERGAHPMRLRDLLDSGVAVFAASDFPGLFPADPLQAIQAMVTRRGGDGEVYAADQAITVAEAVELYTSRAAWGGFEEGEKGTLEVGKLGDLVVLDRDPYDVPPAEIGSVGVLATVVGGRVVHGSLERPSA